MSQTIPESNVVCIPGTGPGTGFYTLKSIGIGFFNEMCGKGKEEEEEEETDTLPCRRLTDLTLEELETKLEELETLVSKPLPTNVTQFYRFGIGHGCKRDDINDED